VVHLGEMWDNRGLNAITNSSTQSVKAVINFANTALPLSTATQILDVEPAI
jgi:hypothetical protein